MYFVTGGTGLLGSHLLAALSDKGKNIKALKQTSSDLKYVKSIFNLLHKQEHYSAIEWIDGDICDFDLLNSHLNDQSTVFHCAAKVSLGKNMPGNLTKINVEGTKTLADVALYKKVKYFCHVSSIAALGSSADVISEETPFVGAKKHSAYALSKYLGELEIWRAMAEGLNASVINPSVIIGPCKGHSGINSLFAMIEKGLAYYPSGENGFVDVRDVVRAMIILHEKNITNERFIISSENLSYHSILESIAGFAGKKAPYKAVGRNLMEIARLMNKIISLFSGSQSGFNKDIARISQKKSIYSSNKFSDLCSFSFTPVENALKVAYEFFKHPNHE